MNQRDVNNLLPRLQRWYAAQCDGDWEHGHGVPITTLDNPGWLVKINLTATSLEGVPYNEVIQPSGSASVDSPDWLHCSVRGEVWQGAGDPTKLARILEEFLAWAEARSG